MRGNLGSLSLEKGHPWRATLVHVPLTVTQTRAIWVVELGGREPGGSLPFLH
jgi:hypothetical protein